MTQFPSKVTILRFQEGHEIYGDTVHASTSGMWMKPKTMHIARSKVCVCGDDILLFVLQNFICSIMPCFKHPLLDDPVSTGELVEKQFVLSEQIFKVMHHQLGKDEFKINII